ncbi:lipoate--protein ligase family protein [Alloscardovia macacae]|uniref:Lipoate-protein ligase A n=1 Tax=Alloscardovia macacae TaxID=1160091 RepID=A0A261F5Y4_9BIFI|nr:biotin/lipoate A/B protein ligase family protein [Alloscardovia macacae]OZG54559.1 lipoate-protein ligase A [Alloscardovia macacae]
MTDFLNNTDTVIRRGEYKVPGGKLVAVQLHESREDGRLRHISLDGDFFIDGVDDPAAVVSTLEHALLGVSASAALDEVQRTYPEAQLVGLTAEAIDNAIARARGVEVASAAMAGTSEKDEEIDILSPAWEKLDLTILDDPEPRSPAMHMALDEVLAREVADGKRGATLRFWQWGAGAVIIGLHQSVTNEVDEERARELGFTVVRRMTGGGAMFVEPGNTITYSLYVPGRFLASGAGVDGEGAQLSGYPAYRRCDEWVLLALNNLGIRAHYKPINDITSPAGKIGGAAQRRFRAGDSGSADGIDANGAGAHDANGSVLHHVTMAYDIDAAKMLDVLRISREKMADKAVKSAAKRVDPLKSQTSLTRDELCAALQKQAEQVIPHVHVEPMNAPHQAETLAAARELAERVYSSEAWTRRIE